MVKYNFLVLHSFTVKSFSPAKKLIIKRAADKTGIGKRF